MTRLIIEPEAEADIADAYDWYEKQRPGLGSDFELCLEDSLQRIQQNHRLFSKIHRNVRRILIHRFPYSILYIEKTNKIIVIAVFMSGGILRLGKSDCDKHSRF